MKIFIYNNTKLGNKSLMNFDTFNTNYYMPKYNKQLILRSYIQNIILGSVQMKSRLRLKQR